MSPCPELPDDVWIVVPAYNEARRLPTVLAQLEPLGAGIVVVDDGSQDETSRAAGRPGVWVLRHPFNLGQGAALQTGIDFALGRGAQYIVTFDADGQHDPADVPQLLRPLQDGTAEVALGSRFLGRAIGIPWQRKLLLKLAVAFTWLFSRIRVTDAHNGLRAFTRRAAQTIRIALNGMAHASEILDQVRAHRLPFCEVPVTIRYSAETLQKGQASWNSVRIAATLAAARILR